MEGNEAPKVDNPQAPSAESKELQQKATELAKVTREKGMGILHGKFPQRLNPSVYSGPVPEVVWMGAFIQGEEPVSGLGLIDTSNNREGGGSIIIRGHEHHQTWLVNKYVPPMEKEEIGKVEIEGKRFGILPKRVLKKEWVDTNTPKTYHGKKGESDWVQFDYYMPTYHYIDFRPNVFVDMSVVVPPDIASQIDEQVAKNVYFPDAFFKALYPGHTGPDNKTHITKKTNNRLTNCRQTRGEMEKQRN